MGMIDSQLIYSDKQTLAAGDSTNTIDFKYKYNGTGGFIQLIGHQVAGATGITVTVKDSDDGSTWRDRETQTFNDINALNSSQCAIALARPLRRFTKLTYAVAGTVSGGSITAFITNQVESPSIYPVNR